MFLSYHGSCVLPLLISNDAAVPFQGEQSYCIANDLVVSKFLDLDNTDERLWVCPHYRDAHFLSATIPRQKY